MNDNSAESKELGEICNRENTNINGASPNNIVIFECRRYHHFAYPLVNKFDALYIYNQKLSLNVSCWMFFSPHCFLRDVNIVLSGSVCSSQPSSLIQNFLGSILLPMPHLRRHLRPHLLEFLSHCQHRLYLRLSTPQSSELLRIKSNGPTTSPPRYIPWYITTSSHGPLALAHPWGRWWSFTWAIGKVPSDVFPGFRYCTSSS